MANQKNENNKPFMTLLSLELKATRAPLEDQHKQTLAECLNQIEQLLAAGYTPTDAQKEILNRLFMEASPADIREATISALKNINEQSPDRYNAFKQTLKTYQTEALSQTEENTAMPENKTTTFFSVQAEIKHLLADKETDHTSEILAKFNELPALYEQIQDPTLKSTAQTFLQSFRKIQIKKLQLNDEQKNELRSKIDDMISGKPQQQEEVSTLNDVAQPQAAPVEEHNAAPVEEHAAEEENNDAPVEEHEEEENSPYYMEPYDENEVINLLDSQNIEEYKASINPKLTKETFENVLFDNAEATATALANPDDMLIAYDLSQNNDEVTTDLNNALLVQLQSMDMSSITPESAYVWLNLAQKIKEMNPNIYADFVSKLQQQLKTYDNQNFASYGFELSPEALGMNYNTASEALKDFEPTTETADEEATLKYNTLDQYNFTDDDGKLLKDSLFGGKKKTEIREAILMQARELAAQELAKEDLSLYTPERRQERLNEVMNEKIESILNGGPDNDNLLIIKFTHSEVIARLAGAQQTADDFKTRVSQKFKDTPFARLVNANVRKTDEKLTKKFGKSYLTAKKFLKLTTKVSWGAAKSVGLFTVAGMASPVGIPALIAYNTIKNWKNIKKQVNDPNISKTKKWGLYAGAVLTTGLSAMTAASGVGAMADAVGIQGVSAFCQQAGTYMGIASRTAAAAIGATIPNWVEKASLSIKAAKLKLQLAQTQDPKEVEELLKKQKEIQKQQEANKNELVEKTFSVALGAAVGMGLREAFSAPATETQNPNAEANMQPASQEAPVQEAPVQEAPVQEALEQEAPVQEASEQEAPVQELTAEQKAAANLEAAKEENSGSGGKSAYDNAKTVLHYLQGHNSADRGIDPDEVAGQLSEHLGTDAGKAAMSCAMAPYALQDALHLDLPAGQNPTTHNMMTYIAEHGLTPEQQEAFTKFTEQNFDENGKFQTGNFSDFQSSHEQADEVHGRKDTTTHTQTSSTRVESTVSHAQPQTEPAVEKNVEYTTRNMPKTGDNVVDYMNDKYSAERVDGKPGGWYFERPTNLPSDLSSSQQQNQTQEFQQPQHQPVEQPRATTPHTQTHTQSEPVYDVTTPAGWAGSRGLILDLKLSDGLNRLGDDHCGGYSAAYIDPRTGQVICVPNDPIHDKPYTIANVKLATEIMRTGGGPWCHSNAGHSYGGYCSDAPFERRLYGSGCISHNNTVNKVITGIHTGINVIGQTAATIDYIKHSR